MRDMLDSSEPYPLTAWPAQFQRIRVDLDDAMSRERDVVAGARAPPNRAASQPHRWRNSGMRSTASSPWRGRQRSGGPRPDPSVAAGAAGRAQHRRRAAARCRTMRARSGRRGKPRDLCAAWSEMSTCCWRRRCGRGRHRHLPGPAQSAHVRPAGRAIGAPQRTGAAADLHAGDHAAPYLARAARRIRPDPHGDRLDAGRREAEPAADTSLRADLREVREIVQSTLDKVRALSQALHP